MRKVAYSLNSPWEIVYGPGDSLWITENYNYVVKRIDIQTGRSTVLLDLSKNKNFNSTTGKWPQGGLMGLALHPSLYSKDPGNKTSWVYLAYVYDRPEDQECASKANYNGPCVFKSRIVRYEYMHNALVHPVTIADHLPGSNDHNSGRLVIGPAESGETGENGPSKLYLYYSIGDMGAGQFNNMSRTNNAQNLEVAEGKILRFNTEPDQDKGQDAWIPNDNPFYQKDTLSAKDLIYSYGHRNPQGLAWGRVGNKMYLYSSEHGPKSDDEINIIYKGDNYGWNRIAGHRDGNYDGMKLGGYGPVDEKAFGAKTIEPIFTLYSATQAKLRLLSEDSFTWPSVAPSGIDVYTSDVIPDWKNSLLITTLKAGKLYRLKLNSEGNGIDHTNGKVDTLSYFEGEGRLRDIAISPDGQRIYLACDIGGPALGKNKTYNKDGSPPSNAGAILEFTFLKDITSNKKSSGNE